MQVLLCCPHVPQFAKREPPPPQPADTTHQKHHPTVCMHSEIRNIVGKGLENISRRAKLSASSKGTRFLSLPCLRARTQPHHKRSRTQKNHLRGCHNTLGSKVPLLQSNLR